MSDILITDITELAEYASLDGCEIGEYVNTLLQLRAYSESHGMTEGFSSELDKELTHWLARFKDETEIEKVTEPQPDITYKQLNWL